MKGKYTQLGWKTYAVMVAIMTLCMMPFSMRAMAQMGLPILGGEDISKELPTPAPIVGAQASVEAQIATGTAANRQSTVEVVGAVVLSLVRLGLIALQAAAVIYFVYLGITMVVTLESEDMFVKKRQTMINAVIGFVVMSLGDKAIEIFNPQTKLGAEAYINPTEWVDYVNVVKDVIKYSVWTVAVVLLVIIGVRMIMSKDKDTKQERTQMTWIAIGLFVMQIADLILTPFLASQDTEFATALGAPLTQEARLQAGNQLINNVTNTILFLFIPFAVFGIIIGSFYLLTARGDESKYERAKNIFLGIVVAAVVSFSAYTIIAEVIRNFDVVS